MASPLTLIASGYFAAACILLFERLGAQAQPKPRRLADAALDEMMRILMTEDERKFDRAELTKALQERMNLPGSRTLGEAFGILGKDERARVEKKEKGRRRVCSWGALFHSASLRG
jgi:hypothetical protein